MSWRVIVEKPAAKFIRKQSPSNQARLLQAIHKLPEQGDIKPMQGIPGLFRLRVGGFRILYTVDHGELIVIVIEAGNRGDVYK